MVLASVLAATCAAARPTERPHVIPLALQPTHANIKRLGEDCARDLRPWLQRCSRTQLARFIKSLDAIADYEDYGSSLFAPSDDAKLTTTRLLRFFAGAPREKSDTLRLVLGDMRNFLSQAQPVRA